MQVEYDKKADTKYVRIRKGNIANTKKECDWLLFDLSKDVDILGIEILDASKNLISISRVEDKFLGYSVVLESKPIESNDEYSFSILSPEYKKDNLFFVPV